MGLPIIDLTVNNEREMKAIIDTGFSGVMMVDFEPATAKLLEPYPTIELHFIDGLTIDG